MKLGGLAAAAALVALGCVLLSGSSAGQEVSLFGVDGLMPQNVYGPVGFAPDAAVREELRERDMHRSAEFARESRGRSQSSTGLRESLGPEAAARLNSRDTNAALKAYRQSQNVKGQERMQELSEQDNENGRMTASTWSPGRYFQARGSGDSLLYSRGTQQALKELNEHDRAEPPRARALSSSSSSTPGSRHGSDLLATELRGDAGFQNVQSRKQALEAIKDMLEQRVLHEPASEEEGGRGEEQQLSSVRGEKLRRARGEGEYERRERERRDRERGMRGRREDEDEEERRLRADSDELAKLGTRIEVRKTDVASVKDEEEARAEEAKNLQQHALGLERKEMALFGKAEMARRSALAEAHRMLGEKKEAREMERKVEYEEKRARQFKSDGEKLKQKGVNQQMAFERLTGPVKKAQQNARLAEHAYTAAELKLAKAETTAEQVGKNPKLAQEAMARIKKLTEAAKRMDELVEQTHARLHSEESNSGPLSGLESQFESPKKRAVRKLARAKRVLQRADALKHKEEAIEHQVKEELPEMDAAIAHAKKLHASYAHLRREAQAAQEKADKAKVTEGRLQHRLAEDKARLSGIRHHLVDERRQYQRME
eukprot:CAMPEP_0181294584 /NCGR_PEP_ID=MMETSP1101-20121128/3686_1 /TAXON_ID=46948 /ORGANISM="Rhodomonas abbreviata, Strain Caron Lab Isolate" /LENGTH=601 /DNA_ID=CAMNT_0023399267 /DNA_START=112 /DNA_END=1917 /DNA_ORIENTATION=+